jgi:hypothetical protein
MRAEVRRHNGTPTLFLDGRPVFYNANWLTARPTPEGTKNADSIRDFAKAGVHLIALDAGTGTEWVGPSSTEPRTGPDGHFDFSTVEGRLRALLAEDPEALFHLRVYMEMGAWWNALYPGEREIADDGEPLNQSYASAVWREQAKAYLGAFAGHLRSVGLLDRVIAWQVEAGICGEWIKNVTSMTRRCGDFSEPMRRHFRAWLRGRYRGDAGALAAAWADPGVSFETADVPPGDMQRATTLMHFRDPAKEMRVIDYYRCLAELSADCVIDLCGAVKEATAGSALAGAFYGYLTELSWNDDFFGSAQEPEWATYQKSGHLGLARVLASPNVDFIVSPYSYPFRGVGGDGLPMPPSEALRRAGKLYIFEEDSRMHNRFDPDGRNYAFEHATAIHQRNMAQVLTHGLGIWWFIDNPPGAYREWQKTEPAFQPWIERFQALGTWAMGLDRTPGAEIAVLLDDESMLYEEVRNSFSLPGIWHQRHQGLSRLGAPYDIYLLDDLLRGDLPAYKLYVFLNAFRLDDGRRRALARQVRRDGRTALWIYAPGFIDDVPSVEAMRELTGFGFEAGLQPWGLFAHVTRADHAITREVPPDLFWGTSGALGPLFHVKDPEATVLGQVVYSLGRCKPGLAVKEFADWRSVYCAAPNVPAPVLRGIAREAGVHLYSDAGDVLYATPDLLAVHTAVGGPRTFRLPGAVEVVYDLYNGGVTVARTDRFDVVLAPASTSLWYLGRRKALEPLLGALKE